MMNPVQQVRRLGQSIWYDNIRRGLIKSGELQRLIDLGVSGLTSNPTIFEKAIAGSSDYDDALLELAREGKGAEEVYEHLAMEDIRAVADALRPVYDQTAGSDGYASLEVSPHLAHDTGGTVAEARRLFGALGRANVMIKVPATPEGMPAIRSLIGEGVNVNATLIFSREAYRQVREAYLTGLEDLAAVGGDAGRMASVASFFVSRVDTAVDKLLGEGIAQGREELKGLLGSAAVANAKLAYRDFRDAFGGERFAPLREKGARVQRPLWGSTSTKNPAYSDVLYVESLIGRDTVNTMPEAALTAFLEHGAAAETLEQDVDGAEGIFQAMADAGISMERVTDKLLADGVKAFADSYDQLLANIEEKRRRLLGGVHRATATGLGEHRDAVEDTLADLRQRDVPARIWRSDHTVWRPEPRGIADRLGWLTVTDLMRDGLETLETFASEVLDAGFRRAVLLGMGGSSLGPEALWQTFGSAAGYPELTILDSSVPDHVLAVTESIEPAETLFVVSSKSGGTVETDSLYRHFRGVLEGAVGNEEAGRHFVAVTGPGTPLEGLAMREGFRRVFLNPSDIGGRYSVLSYFGLLPAALAGIDVGRLLERAEAMRRKCGPEVSVDDNPGAWLGAAMGTLALRGRDKLTLVTSPSVQGLGPWIEQLVAESTGKEGRGVVPVVGEPPLDSRHYGRDRLFVYLRVGTDDNSRTDAFVQRLRSTGQPVVRLELRGRDDLGSEFFRWEFATAVAGAVLAINPFDQPDVQQAKEMTAQVLEEHRSPAGEPSTETGGDARDLLAQARPGDYLAVLTYLRQTPELDRALSSLRRRVGERYRIATTLGYGPRYLHSTGQLHKGGPDSSLFLQITARHDRDLPIPGRPYTFGTLVDAQAQGDLRALRSLGRRAARVRLQTGGAEELEGLVNGWLA